MTDTPPADNPVNALRVSVTVPETITIRMIDATAFNDYELAFFMAGVFASFASGFLVAAIAALSSDGDSSAPLFFSLSALFALFMTGAVVQMLRKRRTMVGRQTSIPFSRSGERQGG